MLLNRRLIIVSFGFMIALAILAGGASILNKWSSQPANSSQSAGNSQGSLADDPWAYLPDTGLVQLTSPVSSTSYYVTNISTIGSLGTPLGTYDKNTPGKQDHLVILDYGTPDWVPQGKGYIYGVKLVNEGINGFHDTSSVINSAVSFARNYYNAVHNWDSQSHLRMVIGVNNCCWYESYDRFAGHGVAWADVVNSIQDQLEYFQYDSQVDVRAGMDIEQDKPERGGDPYATILWLSNYVTNTLNTCTPGADNTADGCFYNFGTQAALISTASCHTQPPKDPSVSSYIWNSCDIGYVSWGKRGNGQSHFARPLPEIYHGHSGSLTWGTDATEWKNLSASSNPPYYAGPMLFAGSLTQRARCSDGCDQGNNYWWEGFQLLSGALASDTTSRQAMHWSTDINYQNP
jgi:hypothetical protein